MAGSSQPARGGSRWRTLKLACYRRDMKRDARCWICGGRIDYQASNNPRSQTYSPDAWEPDHRLPVSEHPELAYDAANILPSHASCNRSRGSKEGIADGLGTASRDWLA